jgi:hypothetical protein
MSKELRLAQAHRRVAEQREWIRLHGDTRAAYRLQYGVAGDPDCYGDGGDAIFEADYNELRKRQAVLAALKGV